jgi:excinuclease ABC subunit C
MFMRRMFPLRTCKNIPKKLCLNFHIGQCLGPCEYADKEKEYGSIIEELKLFLEGKQDELLNSLSGQMKTASEAKDFEKAAKIRDRISALSLISESSPSSLRGAIATKPASPAGRQSKPFIYPSQQIEELRSILNLPKTPTIIEAFDVSNISGKEAVGSMVYFKDGKPNKYQYRHFKIRTVRVIDDYSMMREIVSRRYRRVLEEGGALPELIIIDGGKGHLAAAKKELRTLRLWQIPVISIAKGLDKIYLSEDKEPILLGKFEAALLLVQRIRDEAHRFAIGYHRLLRRKKIDVSELDDIEGIGPKKKLNLIRHFGTVYEIKMADVDDLLKVRFISEKEAKAIYNHFHN